MDMQQVVHILNTFKHRGRSDWTWSNADGQVNVKGLEITPIHPMDAVIIALRYSEQKLPTDPDPAKVHYSACMLLHYASVLRGDEQDLTGCGVRAIFVTSLEHALGVKVITEKQWESFLELEREKR